MLGMVILGGLGSIWGVVVGAITLSFINTRLIPDVLNYIPRRSGSTSTSRSSTFGIYGFLLVIMMILRPQGLIPERRRKMELTEDIGADDAILEEHRERAAPCEPRGAPSPGGEPPRGAGLTKQFGGLTAVDDVTLHGPERVDRLDHRAQRRGQDDVLQHAHRLLQADAREDRLRRARHHRQAART